LCAIDNTTVCINKWVTINMMKKEISMQAIGEALFIMEKWLINKWHKTTNQDWQTKK